MKCLISANYEFGERFNKHKSTHGNAMIFVFYFDCLRASFSRFSVGDDSRVNFDCWKSEDEEEKLKTWRLKPKKRDRSVGIEKHFRVVFGINLFIEIRFKSDQIQKENHFLTQTMCYISIERRVISQHRETIKGNKKHFFFKWDLLKERSIFSFYSFLFWSERTMWISFHAWAMIQFWDELSYANNIFTSEKVA